MSVRQAAPSARGSCRPLVLAAAAVHLSLLVAVLAALIAVPGQAHEAASGAAEALRLWCGVP